MLDMVSETEKHLCGVLAQAKRDDVPFRHWNLRDVLPAAMAEEFAAMNAVVPEIGGGTRAAVNSQRCFLSLENRFHFPFCAELAAALQSSAIVSELSTLCEVDLDGSYLRIEFCQDQDGFWLEPHTDIGAKLFTAQIYLTHKQADEKLGTDLLDSEHNLIVRKEGAFNTGTIFVPSSDTWHAFGQRKISGLRRSLIVNYVLPEWRSRHELAFPDECVKTEPSSLFTRLRKRLVT
jgi:hypothetical protein